MKKVLVFLLLTTIIVSGCGKPQSQPTTTEAEGKGSSEVTDSEESEVVQVLNLEKQVEQLGGESFSEDGLNYNSHIVDKNGYTYVITPNTFARGFDNATAKLFVSILKDEKFVIKEQVIDLTSIIGVNLINRNLLFEFNENNVLIATSQYDSNDLKYEKKLFSVEIKENGEFYSKIIKEGISGAPKDEFVYGLKGSYFRVCTDNQCSIINYDGETMYTYTTSETYPTTREILFDEELSRIYFNTDGGAGYTASAFDIKESDMVWDPDGSEKVFSFPSSKARYIGENNGGFYVLKVVNSTENTLHFYSNEDSELTEEIQTSQISSLESEKVNDNDLTLDDKYINVYRNVIYKGKPTLQKYSYTRVDLSEKKSDKQSDDNTKGDSATSGKFDPKKPSSYEGVWKYYFKENDENSGGYIVTLKLQEGSKDEFDIEVSELTPGATFINGSESAIGLKTGKGFYEFMHDANDNSGMVEIELAKDGIIYKKSMYTNNPGTFSEDVEVKLSIKESL